jgi:hypothetical protein
MIRNVLKGLCFTALYIMSFFGIVPEKAMAGDFDPPTISGGNETVHGPYDTSSGSGSNVTAVLGVRG